MVVAGVQEDEEGEVVEEVVVEVGVAEVEEMVGGVVVVIEVVEVVGVGGVVPEDLTLLVVVRKNYIGKPKISTTY